MHFLRRNSLFGIFYTQTDRGANEPCIRFEKKIYPKLAYLNHVPVGLGAASGDENVARGQVSVDEALGSEVLHAAAHVHTKTDQLQNRQFVVRIALRAG